MPTLAAVLSLAAAKDAVLVGLFIEELLVLSAVDSSLRRDVYTPELQADIETSWAEIGWQPPEDEDDEDA